MRIPAAKAIEAAKALRASLEAAGHTDPDLLIDMIEGETDLFDQIDALLLSNAEDCALLDAIDTAAAKLEARAKRVRARVEARRAMIEQAMMVAEATKLERPVATLSLVARKPALLVTEEAEIPARFWKAGAPKLDRKALTEALADGETIPGATLTNQAPTLTVRSA